MVREASASSFYFFAKEVLGFDKLTAQTHKKWADDLQRKWVRTKKIGRLKPRGTYKTTLYGEAFLLWLWATVSPKIRFAYMSSQDDLLKEVADHLNTYIGFKSESLYALIWPECTRDPEAGTNTKDTFNIRGAERTKGNSLMFRVAGGSTNGLHPHFLIIDDPMDKNDRVSEAVRKQKRNWYDSVHPLLVPLDAVLSNGKKIEIEHILFISTRWHIQDLVSHIKKTDDEFDFEEEGVYLGEERDENGKRVLRYPELFTHSKLESLMKAMAETFFACQYMNDPLPEGHRLFSKEKLRFLRPDLVDWLEEGSNYVFLDPARGKEEGCYPAAWFVNRFSGRNVFFDAVEEKISLDQVISIMAVKAIANRVKLVAYETNGTTLLTKAIRQALKEAADKSGTDRIPPVMEIHESRNKAERIASMQPSLIWGDNFFLEDYAERYPEAMRQITLYPAYGPVDFPDVCEKSITYLEKNAPASFAGGGKSGVKMGDSKKKSSGSLKGSLAGSLKKSGGARY